MPSVGTVHRIQALVDIPRHNVIPGRKGGFLQFEENLSHEGDAWVDDESVVAGKGTLIYEDALVCDRAQVLDNSKVGSETLISGHAKIVQSIIRGKRNLITDEALLEFVAMLGQTITVTGTSHLHRVKITENCMSMDILDNAKIINSDISTDITGSYITVSGNAKLLECREIKGSSINITDDCILTGAVAVNGKRIDLSGASSLDGKVLVSDNVTLTDCARISSLFSTYQKIQDVTVSGDVDINVQHL